MLPTSAEQISEVVKLANRERHPGRPAGRRNRADGRRRPAAARDPRRREADEPDPRDRPRRSHRHGRAGDQHAEALRGAAAARLHLSGRPRLLPVLARRRPHRHERLEPDRRPLRPHARPRHQLRDGAADRRDHPRRRRRRQEDPEVVLRLPAQAPLHGPPGDARHRHRGDARARASAGGGVRRLLLLPVVPGRLEGDRAISRVPASPPSPASCSSTSGSSTTCAATTRRGSRLPTG